MTKEQIEQKAKNVYKRCFDDDFEYTGVLHALEICTEETATEATKKLQEENERITKHIIELQKDKGKLTDENKRLQLNEQLAINNSKFFLEELAEAKEIIKTFLTYEKGEGVIVYWNDFLKKAESFSKV